MGSVPTEMRFQEFEDRKIESYAYNSEKLLGRLVEIAHGPINGDPFYRNAAIGLIDHIARDRTFLEVFHEARLERDRNGMGLPSVTGALLMTSHAVNKILFDAGIYDYPYRFDLHSPEAYREVFEMIRGSDLATYRRIICERSIQTSDPHRGVALPSLLSRMQGDSPFTWTDIGSSDGLIPKRVAHGGEFRNIHPYNADGDQTGFVAAGVNQSVNVSRLIGVDLVNPFKDEDTLAWRLACRPPSKATFQDVEQTRENFRRYADVPYEFVQGNITQGLPDLSGSCDIVTALTVLTHIVDEHKPKAIEEMLKLLQPSKRSLLVAQDWFAKGDAPYGITYVKNRTPFSYGTWVCGEATGGEFWDILRYQDSECKGVIKAGEDFTRFLQATEDL